MKSKKAIILKIAMSTEVQTLCKKGYSQALANLVSELTDNNYDVKYCYDSVVVSVDIAIGVFEYLLDNKFLS